MKYPEIKQRFEYIMNLRNMKPVDLVNKTGINKASISQYCNGNHCPSNTTASLLGKALRVNPLWLMGFDVPMEEINLEPFENQLKDEYEKWLMSRTTEIENDRIRRLLVEFAKLSNTDQEFIEKMISTLSLKKE